MSKTLYIGLGGLGKSTVTLYLSVNKKSNFDVAVVDYKCEGIDRSIVCIEVGKINALYEQRAIRQMMRGYERCIVVCGLGGKCTNEYLPLISEISTEVKCVLEVYATTPFRFEGKKHHKRTIEVLRKLKLHNVRYRLLHNRQILNHTIIEQKGLSGLFDVWIDFLQGKGKGVEEKGSGKGVSR